MKKLIVTGGAGFIGSHVVDALIENGHQVWIIDNLSTGKRENVNSKAKLLIQDITDPRIQDELACLEADAIIHMAAQASVATSTKRALYDANVNIMGSINILEAAKKGKINQVIYTSSAAVYGNPKYLPIDEQHPVYPLSNYGISKYVPERYLEVYSSQYGLNTCTLRLANVYGPRQNTEGEAGVIAIFLDLISKGRKIQIHGDGTQSRDFIYVKDVAEAFVSALEKRVSGVYNIGTGVATSINELFQTVKEVSPGSISMEYGPVRSGDIQKSVLDNSLAKRDLSWEPMYLLKDGVQETSNHYFAKLYA